MNMHHASKVSASWSQHPSAVAEQMRDMADNDNMSAQMQVQAALAWRRWADSKSGPQWSDMQRQARWHASQVMQQHKPKAV